MRINRLAAGLAALLLSLPLMAATVLERSPFAQGLWWEPARSGSGFEMFNAGGQVMVIWYTFDEAGRPTWYTAQGEQQALGAQDWPLMKHRWVGGRKADPVAVGSMRLTVDHPESVRIAWQLGAQRGTATLEPFLLSGVVNETDRSGTWFAPENSGWGLTLTEQGDVTGGALFTYDSAGEPTWAAGFERGSGSVELFVSSGACPSCAYRPPSSVNAGRLSFDFHGEGELVLRNGTSLPMAAGTAIDGARMAQLSRPASTRAADRQLASFDDASLKAYLGAGMMNVPAFFYPPNNDFSASPPAAASTFSTTNLQEEGVDEAALVKTNGTHIYTYGYGGSQRLPQVRIARVDDDGASAAAVGSVAIGTGERTPVETAGLYLYGQSLVSVHGSATRSYAYAGWASGTQWSNGLTQVEILDIAAPDRPVSRWRADIDGYVVASRRVGAKLYVVSRFTPYLTGFTYYASTPAQVATNREILAAVTLDQLLPKARTTDGALAPIVTSASVYAPPQGSRKVMADLIVVTAIDLDTRRIVQSLGIVGGVETVYASASNLFVASTRSELRNTLTGALLPEPPMVRTDLHQVRIGADAMAIVGSASVEGYLSGNLDQAAFRMSEQAGKLRVVTTSRTGLWGSQNANRLTILEPSPVAAGLLKTVSWLPNVRHPQPLGKPGEALYATRFAGERLYAVTFKKIDPLYVVDVSNAGDPFIAGALEIPGFSDYLHPLANGLLLGFGKDTVPAVDFGDGGQFAWYQGLQVALYDVSDAGKPLEMQRVIIGKRGSQSALLTHHHAFSELRLAPDRLRFAIPASVYDDAMPYGGSGPSAFYPWLYSGLLRFELTGSTPADARITTLPTLVSHDKARFYTAPYPDPGAGEGRSVLYPRGSVFVGYGRFWHQDAQGVVAGPF